MCDLYVHTSTGGAIQAWIAVDNLQWMSVDLEHPHPYLKGYVLNFCANGEPSWVKKDTVRTYKGRMKKRERKPQQDKSSGPSSGPLSTPSK
ncbi:hypothetical protein TRAPUB_13858 [Trametes pubescens]|uniref:Uncharacterized protein n=1 Tax=Trametes pubescens TaxID=154538 RepID=A0A1M2VQ64_TRAPU|nr:hypothetical protein TRAPUB_13858 [Trametes pubescens]